MFIADYIAVPGLWIFTEHVRLDMNELDITSAESKATYEEIKSYVAEHNEGMKVSNLYIVQGKDILHREAYEATMERMRDLILYEIFGGTE